MPFCFLPPLATPVMMLYNPPTANTCVGGQRPAERSCSLGKVFDFLTLLTLVTDGFQWNRQYNRNNEITITLCHHASLMSAWVKLGKPASSQLVFIDRIAVVLNPSTAGPRQPSCFIACPSNILYNCISKLQNVR